MRFSLTVAVCCCALKAPAASGDQVFPYKAYITADDVYVRSGPGQSYYPTDKLKAGQQVEVYRHDPGGWYAIRPPEGSFSWVAGRFLEAGVDNLAVVTADQVAARVGSRFSDIRDVIQVHLDKAEVVEVLAKKHSPSRRSEGGRARPSEPAGGRTWYKIAPPSGEFRWVFGKYVDPEYPHDGVRANRRAATEASLTETEPVETSTTTAVVATPRRPVEEPSAVAFRELVAPRHALYEPPASRGVSPEQFQAALEEIDLELSVMVAEEPTVWTFDQMRHRAERLLAQAETALERGRARVLLNKMARFEDIKRRYDRVSLAREQTERSNRRLAALRPKDWRRGRQRQSDGRFDGVGELIRVVSPKLDAPRYALVDPLGQVHSYVSPAPGINLRHYLGRRVGVTGTRGYMPEQRAQHVMARHVSVLDGRRLR